MFDFEVQRCTRRCAKTDREFQPGDVFYSVLTAEGGAVVRSDYSEQAWDEPPEDAISWWRSRMPDPKANRIHWAPNDAMLHYFEQLDGQPDKEDIRYVLALLLLRRRVVRWEASEQDKRERDVMVLYCPRNENEYRAVVATPDDERVSAIQEELAQLLFADAA